MAFTLIEIKQQAAQLLPSDRAKLAEFLLESLRDSVDACVKQIWDEEISRRVSAYENAEVSTFSAEVVFAEAKRIEQ